MDDRLAAQVGHLVWAILITGGGFSALITWWLTGRKKPVKQSHDWIKALDEHKAEDGLKFEKIDGHFEKQYAILLDNSTDLGKIKGKLGIE